jgi:hypothetical protein
MAYNIWPLSNALFLSPPCCKIFWRHADGKCIFIQYDGGVFLIGHFVYKKIVIAAGNMVQAAETFHLVKQVFAVAKVAPNTHVGYAGQVHSSNIAGPLRMFPSEPVCSAGRAFFRMLHSQYQFLSIMVGILHFCIHHSLAGRQSASVSSITSYLLDFYAHTQRPLFPGNMLGFLGQRNGVQVFEIPFAVLPGNTWYHQTSCRLPPPLHG